MPHEGPRATVDVIIEVEGGIVLVRRRYPPLGWAIPGGFVDRGERAEDAARREMREETSLDVELVDLLGVYSDPARDARGHTLSTVYVGRARGRPRAGDDAMEAGVFSETTLPAPLVFDHARIVDDYFRFRRTGERPRPA
ncbi:MAG TPA: NUDIX hydrolase [Candidatus Binatus sp.]|nr:NUDIX hydrolase [Candidatus Binatus sp.]